MESDLPFMIHIRNEIVQEGNAVSEGIWQKIEVETMNVVLVNGEKR